MVDAWNFGSIHPEGISNSSRRHLELIPKAYGRIGENIFFLCLLIQNSWAVYCNSTCGRRKM